MLSLLKEETNDQIINSMTYLGIKPRTVLEIGCSDGWRLEIINRKYKAKCYGIDPSEKAIMEGRENYPSLNLEKGTAENLPYKNNQFETVILGFCLYLCDRDDLFKIACEVDRVLKNNGCIIILDFNTPFAYRNNYIHFTGLYTYKMDYAKMFSWNPYYTVFFKKIFPMTAMMRNLI